MNEFSAPPVMISLPLGKTSIVHLSLDYGTVLLLFLVVVLLMDKI